MASVDVPDRYKPTDELLDYINDHEIEWKSRLAIQAVENVGKEWVAIYVASQALTMVDAPIAERRAVAREIRSVMIGAELFPAEPLELPPTEG